MKKFFLLICLFLWASISFADNIFNDGFEYGNTEFQTPVGWICEDEQWTCGYMEKDHNRLPHQGEWYIFSDADESWLFLSMDFIEAVQYGFSFWTITDGSFDLEVLYGTSPDPNSMTDTIMPLQTIDNDTYEQLSSFFVGKSSGLSYIAIHSSGNVGASYITIDDVTVDLLLEYDFNVEAVPGDTSLYLGENGNFRFKILNTGFNTERLIINGSNEFFSDLSFSVNGEVTTNLVIEPAETVFVDVDAHLPESTVPNSVVWLDVMVSSTHNCHTGLATFWVTPLALVSDFPLYQPLNTEAQSLVWIVRGEERINWKWCQSGDNPTCSPAEGEGMLTYAASFAEIAESSLFISPKLNLNATDNLVRFQFYRTAAMSGKSDLINVYFNEAASIDGAQLLGTVHRCSLLSPVEDSEGWHQYDFVFNCANSTKGFVIFEAVSDAGLNMFLDDILIDNTPLSLTESVSAFYVYPNPVTEVLHIEADDLQQVYVMDLSGKLLKSCSFVGEKVAAISFSDLPQGLYVVEIISGGIKTARTVVKQ